MTESFANEISWMDNGNHFTPNSKTEENEVIVEETQENEESSEKFTKNLSFFKRYINLLDQGCSIGAVSSHFVQAM